MTASKSDAILVVRESFIGRLNDGSEFVGIAERTRVRADHPAALKWPNFFEPVDFEIGPEPPRAEKRGA